MGINIGPLMLIILGLFIAKISFDNIGQAEAKDKGVIKQEVTIRN